MERRSTRKTSRTGGPFSRRWNASTLRSRMRTCFTKYANTLLWLVFALAVAVGFVALVLLFTRPATSPDPFVPTIDRPVAASLSFGEELGSTVKIIPVRVTGIEIRQLPPPDTDDICVKALYFLRQAGLAGLLGGNDVPLLEPIADPLRFSEACTIEGLPVAYRSWSYKGAPVQYQLSQEQISRIRGMYPFDDPIVDMYVLAEVTINGETAFVPPTLAVLFPETEDLIVQRQLSTPVYARLAGSTGSSFYEGRTMTNPPSQPVPTSALHVQINVERSFSRRLLTVLLPLLIFVFILVIVFLSDTSTAIEAIIAILLGLWGLHTILVPDRIGQSLLIDRVLISLYVVLAWVTLYRFIVKPAHIYIKQQKKS